MAPPSPPAFTACARPAAGRWSHDHERTRGVELPADLVGLMLIHATGHMEAAPALREAMGRVVDERAKAALADLVKIGALPER